MTEDYQVKKSPVLPIGLGAAAGVGSYFAADKIDGVKKFVSEPAQFKDWNELVSEKQDVFDGKVKDVNEEDLVNKAKTARERVAQEEKAWEDGLAKFKEENKFVETVAEGTADNKQQITDLEAQLATAEKELETKKNTLIEEKFAELQKGNKGETRTIAEKIDPDTVTQEMIEKRGKEILEQKRTAFRTTMDSYAKERAVLAEKAKNARGQEKKQLDKQFQELEKEIKDYIRTEVKTWNVENIDTAINKNWVAIEQYYNNLDNVVLDNSRVNEVKQLLTERKGLLEKLRKTGFADAAAIIEREGGIIDRTIGSDFEKAMGNGFTDFKHMQTFVERFNAVPKTMTETPLYRIESNGQISNVFSGQAPKELDQVQEFLKGLNPKERTRLSEIFKRNGMTEITGDNIKTLSETVSVYNGTETVRQLQTNYDEIGKLIQEQYPSAKATGHKVSGGKIVKANGFEFHAAPIIGDAPKFRVGQQVPERPFGKTEYINDWKKTHTTTVVEGVKPEAEIRQMAKDAVEKGEGLKEQTSKVSGLKKAIEDAKNAVKPVTQKAERTADELEKMYIDKVGTKASKTEAVKKELEDGVKKLFENGGKNGWKMAGVVAAGTAIGAILGLIIRPSHKEA